MGTCDSSIQNRKLISKSNISNNIETSEYFSSSSLPTISSSVFSQKNISHINKKHNSTDKTNPLEDKQYILSERIAKREDITKKYKISKKVLGDGATALVYLAENSNKERVAIKRILKDNINNSRQKNIIKEAETCLKLKNKHIINHYEIYEDIHYINIVMELGDTDLFELIINSPLGVIPEEIAVDFLIQIFESIDYLHNVQNIVHCDIKPENYVVIFDKKNNKIPILKLVDFGNIRKKPINKERLYNFSGTKEYMAPEAMENYGFNEKIDEWAAGIIMFNMLTGADPFMSDTDSQYRDNIKFKEIKFEYIRNKKLRELNKKLLNRYIAKRITAKEALEELKTIKKEFKSNFNLNISKNAKEDEPNLNNIKNKISLMNIS